MLRSGKASNSGLLLKLVEDKLDTGGGSNFSYFKTLLKIKINMHIPYFHGNYSYPKVTKDVFKTCMGR